MGARTRLSTAVQLLLLTIYPTLIQPLFNKVTPLEPSELRSAIEALARRVQFPLTQLYVIDGSKRSGHSNGTWHPCAAKRLRRGAHHSAQHPAALLTAFPRRHSLLLWLFQEQAHCPL